MNEKDGRGFYLVAEARYAYRPTLLEDRHMWRMLLAKLHPDAGGDHELFLFASALKEGVCGGRRLGRKHARNDDERRAERPAEHFPRAWQDAMSSWALSNREALKTRRAYK
jgi:hypothetical protein